MKPSISPQDYAKKQYNYKIKQGFQLIKVHEYKDAQGNSLYFRARFKNPDTGKKCMPAFHIGEDGKYVGKEPDFPDGKPLYGLHTLTSFEQKQVFVVEGEQKVDALNRLGIPAITSGSGTSDEGADWSCLAGLPIIVWPDLDKTGAKYANKVAQTLSQLGCSVEIIAVEQLGLQEGGDIIDWLALHPEATMHDILALSKQPFTPSKLESEASEQKTEGRESKPHQTTELVRLGQRLFEFFSDSNRVVYARNIRTSQTYVLISEYVSEFLLAEYFELNQRAASSACVKEALQTLAGLARKSGKKQDVWIRYAPYKKGYLIDLAESDTGRVIHIDAISWKALESPPVLFVRSASMHPLPTPVSGGSVDDLWGLVNIPEHKRLLVITWILDCFRPNTPCPLLELMGEHGSAKSSTQDVLRGLVDPNACNLRGVSKNVEDVFVSAGENWLLSMNNVSSLSSAIQDALCQIAYGGGYSTRKLYSNRQESVIAVKRPCILNGINAVVTQQDLIDRTISIDLLIIQERREAKEIEEEFLAKRPEILGALFDIMAKALAILPTIKLSALQRPRLIEFALLGCAVAKAMGYTQEDFLSQFQTSRKEAIERVIEDNPVAVALIAWFEKRGRRDTEIGGTLLMDEVSQSKPSYGHWPSTTRTFGDAVRRMAPALRQLGVDIVSLGKIGGNYRWRIVDKAKE